MKYLGWYTKQKGEVAKVDTWGSQQAIWGGETDWLTDIPGVVMERWDGGETDLWEDEDEDEDEDEQRNNQLFSLQICKKKISTPFKPAAEGGFQTLISCTRFSSSALSSDHSTTRTSH